MITALVNTTALYFAAKASIATHKRLAETPLDDKPLPVAMAHMFIGTTVSIVLVGGSLVAAPLTSMIGTVMLVQDSCKLYRFAKRQLELHRSNRPQAVRI